MLFQIGARCRSGNGGDNEAYVYDCFVAFVLTTSTENVSYSKTVI